MTRVKLVVAPFTELRTYVSREFWSTFSFLADRHGWQRYETCHVTSDFLDLLRLRFGAIPNVVLFWESYPQFVRHAAALAEAGARLYVMTDDLHRPGRDGMREALRVADGILSTYAPRLGEFFPEVDPSKVTWVPHAASPDFLLPVAETPAPVVFVSGAISNVYPLRQTMRDLALRRPELARLHGHPGYFCNFNYGSDRRIGRGYAEAIRACLAAFTDGLTYRYVVAKHFEIPATGALLIADRACSPQLATLGFDDGVHYLAASAEDLEQIVERALDPSIRAEIDAIRRRGHALVHARHTTAQRAGEIDVAT
jgi:hypothetical protein